MRKIKKGDDVIVIVGKDKDYQMPGGHPEHNETNEKALHREVQEETGIDLKKNGDKAKLFGYYLVEDDFNDNWNGKPYLQLRYFLKSKKKASDIDILAAKPAIEYV